MKIAVAGTGYVGLSLAILFSQRNEVTAVDIIPAKVDLINNRKSPIVDKEIEEYLATKELNLKATTDGDRVYKEADYVMAIPLRVIWLLWGQGRCSFNTCLAITHIRQDDMRLDRDSRAYMRSVSTNFTHCLGLSIVMVTSDLQGRTRIRIKKNSRGNQSLGVLLELSVWIVMLCNSPYTTRRISSVHHGCR